MRIEVQGDVRQQLRALTDIQRKVIPQATISALNKTNRTVNKNALQSISRSTGLKQKTLKKRKVVVPFKANRRRMAAGVFMNQRLVKASDFQRRAQRSFSDSELITVKGDAVGRPFRAKMRSGHQGIYRRKQGRINPAKRVRSGRNAGKRYRSSKIAEQYVRLDSRVDYSQLNVNLNRIAQERWRVEFPREINFRLRRRGLL